MAATATGYTRRNGLSRGALRQAQRRLEKLGAWTRSRKRVRETAGAETRVSFARVAVQSGSAPAASAVRLRIAPGVELEWSTPPEVEILAALVERLAARA